MKNPNKWLVTASLTLSLLNCPITNHAQSQSESTKWHWDKGTIVVETPERPAGPKDAIGLTAPKLEVVRVGFVGLGMRGPGAVERFTHIPGVQIVALCDYEKERAEACQKYLKNASLPKREIGVKFISFVTSD